VQVSILNAARNGAVTVKLDGTGPTYVGQTDPNTGNAFFQSTETANYVGQHTEVWYVNGVQVPPSNPGWPAIPYAPILPIFTVYSAFSGMNCSGQSQTTSQCSSSHPYHWIWQPVTVANMSSAVSPSQLDTAVSDWNGAAQGGAISLSTDTSQRVDVQIFDNSNLATYAVTETWGQECDSYCYNQIDLCTGACANSSAVYFVDIFLNPGNITNLANAISNVGYDASGVTTMILDHELGHALRLSDVPLPGAPAATGGCSEAQDIMYQGESSNYLCGLRGPASCDMTAINGVYPTPVGVCPTTTNNYCDGQHPC
jgi:hypothetical protein